MRGFIFKNSSRLNEKDEKLFSLKLAFSSRVPVALPPQCACGGRDYADSIILSPTHHCPSIHAHVHVFTHLYTHINNLAYTHPSVYTRILDLSMHTYILVPIHTPIYPSIDLSFIYLSIHIAIHPSIQSSTHPPLYLWTDSSILEHIPTWLVSIFNIYKYYPFLFLFSPSLEWILFLV